MTIFYEKEFFQDLTLLNCEKPSIVLRVTQHIPEIILFIQKLIDSELAYETSSGDVYFRTQRFSVKSFFTLQTGSAENENIKGIFVKFMFLNQTNFNYLLRQGASI